MHARPSSQAVAPVQPFPPQRPQRAATDSEAALAFSSAFGATGAAALVVSAAALEVAAGAVAAAAVVEALTLELVSDEATLATLATVPALLVEAEEEESLPTPALVFSAVTSSAEMASQTDSPAPTASIAAVSVNEPKSPESAKELAWQSRPRAAEQEAASPAVGTLNSPLVSLRVAADAGALQPWKTLPSNRILAPASTSKLWLYVCQHQLLHSDVEVARTHPPLVSKKLLTAWRVVVSPTLGERPLVSCIQLFARVI